MLPNAAQFNRIAPSERAPQRADIFKDSEGQTRTIIRVIKTDEKDRWRVVYECSGWHVRATIRQEANYQYRQINPENEELHYRAR